MNKNNFCIGCGICRMTKRETIIYMKSEIHSNLLMHVIIPKKAMFQRNKIAALKTARAIKII